MRFAIVGTGKISSEHSRAIRAAGDDAEVTAVVSRSIDRAERWAAQHGARAYTSVRAAVSDASVDVVVVCTETGTHAEHAIAALEAGAHVLIEKPAEVGLARIDDIVRARDASGAVVSVVSQHRFDVATERAAAAIREGTLGRITSAVAGLALWRDQAYYDSAQWRGTRALDGGGALMNQGVHVVDVLLDLMGPAVEVSGETASLGHEGLEVEDVAVGTVRFASGALAVLHASTAAYPGGEVGIQVHGDRGSAVIRNDRLEWLGAGRVDDPGTGDALARQYADVVTAVRSGGAPRVSLEEARAAVELITAVYESGRTGRRVRLGRTC